MLIRRFYDDKLAQASYLLGCQATGDALVVDPNRDVEQYIRAAEQEGVRITHVTETHIHADFASGARELALRAGATLYLSDEGDADWKYAYAAGDGAMLVKDGDTFMVGNLKVEVLHTPGHTPEHIVFMVTDTPATDRPVGVFTGDFIFVGDVGRPDLLERAAKYVGTMEAGARTLFRSLQRFKARPDYLQLWPGHGAGSACGKALGAVPSTTLGYEKIANWGLVLDDEEEFVRQVLAGQPEPPKYFAEMKRINKMGPRILGRTSHPPRVPAEQVEALLEGGALVVDTRTTAEFARGHIPGTINVPLNKSFTTWAGWLVPYDRDFHLIVDDTRPHGVDEAVRDLAMIGLDRVAGFLGSEILDTWLAAGRELETIPQMTTRELWERFEAAEPAMGRIAVVDVRRRTEWEAGHLPGVEHITLGHLADHLDRLERDVPLVLQCQTGNRSSIGASVLRARGFRNVVNLVGGFAEWQKAGHPVERGAASGAGVA